MSISIFISTHKETDYIQNAIFKPIQLGCTLNKCYLPGMIHDNEGDNISKKNSQYCELTGQYWAWKNVKSDYYGFFHYRRYLSFNTSKHYKQDTWGNVCEPFFYDGLLEKYSWDEASIRELIEKYDVVLPAKKDIRTMPNMGRNMHDQYTAQRTLHEQDLQIMLDVIREKYPDYSEYAEQYEKGYQTYFNNMFIMKKEIFESYSKWLFDILDECVKRGNYTNYSAEALRTPGHLAERLLNIYILYLQHKKDLKFKELQTVFIENTEPQKEITPIFDSQATVLALSINDFYVPFASVMLQSIHEHMKPNEKYDIIIMNRDVSEVSKKGIRSIFKNMENVSVRFFNVSRYENQFKNLFLRGHFALETYFRLLLPNIMQDYKKVLYLDSDLVVVEDIAEIFNTDIEGYLLAACHDADTAGLYNGYAPDKKQYMDTILKIKEPYQYFQAGVVLFNLEEFRKKYTIKEMLEFASSYPWQLLDQDVLNYLAQGNYKAIDMKWNVMTDWNRIRIANIISRAPKYLQDEYKAAHEAPSIIHYAGPDKPWHQPYSDYAEVFWHYARKTSYYEVLIQRLCIRTLDENRKPTPKKIIKETLKKFADPLFPKSTKRRELLKKTVRKIKRML